MTYSEIWHRIATSYDDGEARAIARILIEELFGLSYTDIVCGATEQLSADDTLRLDTAVRRIEQGEPLQHVLGYADFCGNRFCVNGSVLIPRPETEWLVDEGAKLMDGCIASDETQHKAPHSPKRILDIGTGSGCIAISLKLRLGDAYVEAWDISEEALRTAQDNADALKAEVVFRKRDALRADNTAAPWDLIVSNPPYICDSERTAMDDNVLLHEPHTALFVPDDDPLRFYRAIARYALLTLNIGGSLLFECNTRYAEATGTMLRDMGFEEVTVSDDCFNLPRFVRGSSPSQPSPSGRA
ncbi:peptide chain release factor N(5)-glutamine methyltransferase [Leyella stercorea]|uniref:peptide chain release factor N(5)-glutamine methyltransferase n=1 Tax=Leyella stercorea TaxID=363265 RepID=UPI0026DB5764|nr:peptide chain release factor N(5)-glutamine methyltransferase [Leyella stercorea]